MRHSAPYATPAGRRGVRGQSPLPNKRVSALFPSEARRFFTHDNPTRAIYAHAGRFVSVDYLLAVFSACSSAVMIASGFVSTFTLPTLSVLRGLRGDLVARIAFASTLSASCQFSRVVLASVCFLLSTPINAPISRIRANRSAYPLSSSVSFLLSAFMLWLAMRRRLCALPLLVSALSKRLAIDF